MPITEKRSIALAADLAAAVDQAVAHGEYDDASEVIGDALRQWKERRELHGYTVEEMRMLADEGAASGEPRDGEEAFRRVRERLARRSGGKSGAR